MICIEPDVDYFRLHLRHVRVPVSVLEQSPDAIAATSTPARSRARAEATGSSGARRSGPTAPFPSSSTALSKGLAAAQGPMRRRDGGSEDGNHLSADEASSCAKVTLEERADAVHRALLSAQRAHFPYEIADTLEHVYLLAVTHCAPLLLAHQAATQDALDGLTSLSSLLPEELRYRTFPSHLNVLLDPASAAADAAEENGSSAGAVAPVPQRVPATQHFYDSFFLLSRALTPDQQVLYRQWQRSGRCPVSCDAVQRREATVEKCSRGGGTRGGHSTETVCFSVIQGHFIHCVPTCGSVGSSAATAATGTSTSRDNTRRVVGESESYTVSSTAPKGDRGAQATLTSVSLPEARSLFFSVYRIPLSRFRPAEQQYYTSQREELRWRQRHRVWRREGQTVKQVSSSATSSCGLWSSCSRCRSSESEDEEDDWEREVDPAGKAAPPRRAYDAADALEQLFSREGHGVGGAAEQTSVAEQRSATRFFRTCHEVLTNYAIAHSLSAATRAVENEEAAAGTRVAVGAAPSSSSDTATAAEPSPAHQQHCHPRPPPSFPRRFPGISYVGVARLLYSLAPCDCYHLVKDGNPLYDAHSCRASYEPQAVPLCLFSDLSPEPGAAAGTQRQRGGTGGGGSGALQLAQLKLKPSRRAAAARGVGERDCCSNGIPDSTTAAASVAPFVASASAAEARSPTSGVAGDGAHGAAAGGCQDGLVRTLFPSRASSPDRAGQAAATVHGTSHPPHSVTDGFLLVSASLICNSISGNPMARPQSLVEKGVRASSFLLPDGARTGGGTEPGRSCRAPHVAASARKEPAAAAVNLFKALSQSSLAQHKLRYGSIRPIISVAVLDSSQRMSGGASPDDARSHGIREATQLQLSQHYCCRGLVDHTWFSIPVQRTPAEQEAIQWMPVMLGSTECVSDVGLRTAVHLGIFPCASLRSRGASGGPADLASACPSAPPDQCDGVLPTREGALSSLKPSQSIKRADSPAALRQTAGSGAAAVADYTHISSSIPYRKKDMGTAVGSLAPLRALPVNYAEDYAEHSFSGRTACPSSRAGIHVGAARPSALGNRRSPRGGRECGREATAACATRVAPEQSLTWSAEGGWRHDCALPSSLAARRTKTGVPLALDSTGGGQPYAVPHGMTATTTPPITRSSLNRRLDAQAPCATAKRGCLFPTAAVSGENGEVDNKHVGAGMTDEEKARARPPPVTATSVRMARGGIALTFDVEPAQQRKPSSSAATSSASAACRRSAHPAMVNMRRSTKLLGDGGATAHGSRSGKSAARSAEADDVSVETASDSVDADSTFLKRHSSPSRTRGTARTLQATTWTTSRGPARGGVLAAAENAEHGDRHGGGAGGRDGATFGLRGSDPIAAALPYCIAGTLGPQQAVTKTINWADQSLPSAVVTSNTGTHRRGSPSSLPAQRTTVEAIEMEKRELQLDAARSVRGGGATWIPAALAAAAAAEHRAGAFDASCSNYSSISSGSLQANLSVPHPHSFRTQPSTTSSARSDQPYHVEASSPLNPTWPPRWLGSSTPFPPSSGPPRHAQQQQQQRQTSRPTGPSGSVRATPTQSFSLLPAPLDQNTELSHRKIAPAPEHQLSQHMYQDDGRLLPASRQHGSRTASFFAASAPHLSFSPSALDLSASGVSVSSKSDSTAIWLPPHQIPSVSSSPPQERFFDDPIARRTAHKMHELHRGTPTPAAAATPVATSDGSAAPRSAQSATNAPTYFSMAWNARKTVQGASESVPCLSPDQQRLSPEVAECPFPSSRLSPTARRTIGAGRLSFPTSAQAQRYGSGGGGGLFIDEYDDAAVTTGSAPHLGNGGGRAASRVRPRGLSAMDTAWWQPVHELSSAPNLRHGITAPVARLSRSSTSALRFSGTEQPYNLPLGAASSPNGHRGELYGDERGYHRTCGTIAGDPSLQQRGRRSYDNCVASAPGALLGGARHDSNRGADDVFVEELSLSPVRLHRTQQRTPFAVRRARRAASATACHRQRLSSRCRPPLAPRTAGGDLVRDSRAGGADVKELYKSRPSYGAATPMPSAARRDGLSVRERVQLRRWELERGQRLTDYQAYLQENYLCGPMPKRYCFERQASDTVADPSPSASGSGIIQESGVSGSGQQRFATVGGTEWSPRTTAVPPAGRATAAVSQAGRKARDFSIGMCASAPASAAATATPDGEPLLRRPPAALGVRASSVDAARACQAEARLRQQAEQRASMEARQQMEELVDGADAAQLSTGVNVSFTLRDVATVFLRLPTTSLRMPRTPGSEPPHVSGGSGLEVLDICDATCRSEGISCFLSRKPARLRGGRASYLERINLYQEPFFLRDQAFVLLLPVPHAPALKVCVAVHNINDLLALVCQTPVASIFPTAEEARMRRREYAFVDVSSCVDERREPAARSVGERRCLFGLFTTGRPFLATGARARLEAQQPLPSSEDDDVARRETSRRLHLEHQGEGLRLTWHHRARLWYALLRAGLNCLELPARTSPLLTDPVACKARCALLCDRIAAYAVARHRLETLKAIQQSHREAPAAEVSKERLWTLSDGTQLDGTGDSSGGRLAASRLLCPSLLTPEWKWGEDASDDGVCDKVHQSHRPAMRSSARGFTLREGLFGGFSGANEAFQDPQVMRNEVAPTVGWPSTAWGTPPLAASASTYGFATGHHAAGRQTRDRGDSQLQRAGTPMPTGPCTIRNAARNHASLRELNSSLRDGRTVPPPLRTTRSMQLRLAANQRVAAGDAPVSSLRHATHASVIEERRLAFDDGERRSDTFGLRSRCSFKTPPRPSLSRGSAPLQQPCPRGGSGCGDQTAFTCPTNARDGDIGSSWSSAHTRVAKGAAHSTTMAVDRRSGASSAAHGSSVRASCTIASSASGAPLSLTSSTEVEATAKSAAQRTIPASSLALGASAVATHLSLLPENREVDLVSALALLAEQRAASVVPPLTTVLSFVPLALQPFRGAGAGIVEDDSAPMVSSPGAGSASPLYAGFVPNPLEVQQRLPQPFDLSIAQVQQLLQWQWEHHQHSYTLIPVPLRTSAAAGPAEVDFSLKRWSSPHCVESASRGGLSKPALSAAPSYAVSPLARELLLHLLRWSWLLPVDYEASQRSGRHRLATTATISSGLYSFMRSLLVPSSIHRPQWRTLVLIALLIAATENSAWCLRALLFTGTGYCAFNCATVGLLTRLPSHRGACGYRGRGGWRPWRWWRGTADVRRRGGDCRSVCRLAHPPSSALESEAPPLDDRVSLLYCIGESTTQDMLEQRRAHVAAHAVLVRVLPLQSAAASLLSRLQLFSSGYSTALSLWVALLLLAHALLYVVYLEAVRAVQRGSFGTMFASAVGPQRRAAWPAECDGGTSDETLSALRQRMLLLARATWTGLDATAAVPLRSSQSAASASTAATATRLGLLPSLSQAVWRRMFGPVQHVLAQRRRPVVHSGEEAAAVRVAGAAEAEPPCDSDAAVAVADGGTFSAVSGAALGHHDTSSFYQNGKYYAYGAELPAGAEQAPSECLRRGAQRGARGGNDGNGGHWPGVLHNQTARAMSSGLEFVALERSGLYVCPDSRAAFSTADPSVLWFLVAVYVVTVCLSRSPYRWLWRRVWSVLTHDDALARRPLLTV
ncbi:hypothetical protein LSCM1_06288 [Leishmania martiniquensis]|uniref:Uncharacterized protein n=1 Tax=Leishmania martiniquensis TaxID=1580590 RepID=A0A836GUU7_9TRYP|nr:hypothetical protein LSCM1_06288 [Leishmania martiniquensis]